MAWISIGFLKFPLNSMEFHRIPWISTTFNGCPSNSMVFFPHGLFDFVCVAILSEFRFCLSSDFVRVPILSEFEIPQGFLQDFNGTPQISTGFHGFLVELNSTGFYRFPMDPMGFHRIPRISTEFHGFTLRFNGFPTDSMNF